MLGRWRLRFVIMLALAALTSRADAYQIIDQQNTFSNSVLGPSSSPGQSFTPTLSGIDFATFALATSDPTNGALVFAVLFEGDGFGGSPVSASSNDVLVLNTSSFQSFEFDFSPSVSLTPGQVYTLQLVDATGQTLYEAEAGANPYAGGVEYVSSGVAQTGYDMVFSEGVQSLSVPEPGPLVQCGVTGLAVLGVWGWRRARVAPFSCAGARR